MRVHIRAAAICFATCAAAQAQVTEDIRNTYSYSDWFTQPGMIPKGCLTVDPAVLDIPPESQIFFDQTFQSVFDGEESTDIRIRAWRIGCHEPDRSAVALNFHQTETDNPFFDPIRYPLSEISLPRTEDPIPVGLYRSGLTNLSEVSGQSGGLMTQFELTRSEGYTLLVDSNLYSLDPDQYNSQFTLQLIFGPFDTVTITVPAYEPALDPPQFAEPVFNGRYSGQWVVDGLPRSGLVLQFGEQGFTNPPFIFAVWFTYKNGEPFWITGNRTLGNDADLTSNELTVEMLELSGGEFVTLPGSYTIADTSINSIGTMTLRAVNCNKIEADLDFQEGGLGTQSLTFTRLIRLAGFDCDQTR